MRMRVWERVYATAIEAVSTNDDDNDVEYARAITFRIVSLHLPKNHLSVAAGLP